MDTNKRNNPDFVFSYGQKKRSESTDQLSSKNYHLKAEPQDGNMEYKFKLTNLTEEQFTHRVTQLLWRINESESSEAIYEIGVHDSGYLIGLSKLELEESLHNLSKMALQADCTMGIIKMLRGERGFGAEVLLQKKAILKTAPVQVIIAVAGDIDVGKSTLIGVLRNGGLDDGRGLARNLIFKHNHEVQSGRTSCVSQHAICFNKEGQILNSVCASPLEPPTKRMTTTATTSKTTTNISSNRYINTFEKYHKIPYNKSNAKVLSKKNVNSSAEQLHYNINNKENASNIPTNNTSTSAAAITTPTTSTVPPVAASSAPTSSYASAPTSSSSTSAPTSSSASTSSSTSVPTSSSTSASAPISSPTAHSPSAHRSNRLRSLSDIEVMSASTRMISFLDLAGHEKYFSSTVTGMSTNRPEICLIVISARQGIRRMTREHLLLASALHCQIVIVITKIETVKKEGLDKVRFGVIEMLEAIRRPYVCMETPSSVSDYISGTTDNLGREEIGLTKPDFHNISTNNSSNISNSHSSSNSHHSSNMEGDAMEGSDVTATSRNNSGTTTSNTAPSRCPFPLHSHSSPALLGSTDNVTTNSKTTGNTSTGDTSNPIDIEKDGRDSENKSHVLPVPIFQISCVTGENLELLRSFLFLLPAHQKCFKNVRGKDPEILIIATYRMDSNQNTDGSTANSNGADNRDSTNFINDGDSSTSATGSSNNNSNSKIEKAIVLGKVLAGDVTVGQKMLLGPDSLGEFTTVQITGIQINRVSLHQAIAGQSATFAIQSITSLSSATNTNSSTTSGSNNSTVFPHSDTKYATTSQDNLTTSNNSNNRNVQNCNNMDTTVNNVNNTTTSILEMTERSVENGHSEIVPLSCSNNKQHHAVESLMRELRLGIKSHDNHHQNSDTSNNNSSNSYSNNGSKNYSSNSNNNNSSNINNSNSSNSNDNNSSNSNNNSSSHNNGTGSNHTPTATTAAVPSGSYQDVWSFLHSRRNGLMMLSLAAAPSLCVCWQFQAEIVVMYHPSKIRVNYEPVLHICGVRQSAKILSIGYLPSSLPKLSASSDVSDNHSSGSLLEGVYLRTGDRALCRFQFLYYPEYIRVGSSLVFREGRARGAGSVTAVFSFD